MCVRLTRVDSLECLETTCCDVYSFCVLLPMFGIVVITTSTSLLSVLALCVISLHTFYEWAQRVYMQKLCIFPVLFTAIYLSCISFLCIQSCNKNPWACALQLILSAAFVFRYFFMQQNLPVLPE